MLGVQIMDAIINGDHQSVDEYRRLFDTELVAIIVETFEKVDEIMRLPLHACRRSWQSRFPASTLEQLDRSLNAIDPAWPITTPTTAEPVKSTKPAKAWRPKPKRFRPTILPEAAPQLADEKKKETFDADVNLLIEKLTCLCIHDCF
uniref:F-box domain-containing protein n=1 Tax=Panagrellus redivivus TaxID=6233 RepID=A0A7E4VYB3_PANRE